MKPRGGSAPSPLRGDFTSYIAYLYLENGKKIRINKTFGTKAEAQKELKIAEKELKSVVGIAKTEVVSTSPAKPKKPAASKPASTPKATKKAVKTTDVPKTGLVVLKFINGKTNHLVGIAPAQLSVVKQAFTSVKCDQASVSLSPSKMTITAINKDRVCIVKLTVPVRTGSGLKCEVDPSDFVKPVDNKIFCLDREPPRLNQIFRDFSLAVSMKAQASAKAIRDVLAPHSTGKNGKFNRVTVKIGAKSKMTVTDEDHNPVSTSVPMRKLAGTGHDVMSYYQTGYIYNALKIFGSASIVVGMKGDYHPIAISGINKGIRIEYICAPVIENE